MIEKSSNVYEKYVHQCIALILEGIQDGRQGEKLKTILPITNLNLVMDEWMDGWMKQWTDGSLRVQTICYFSLLGDSVVLYA